MGGVLPTAVFYGVTSIGIIACNKITLTTYGFPSSSCLALGQFAVTCASLAALHGVPLLRPAVKHTSARRAARGAAIQQPA